MLHVLGSEFRRLVSLRCHVTMQCPHHRHHECWVEGPYMDVLDLVGTFRQFCAEQDRWVILEYEPSEVAVPFNISDWE